MGKGEGAHSIEEDRGDSNEDSNDPDSMPSGWTWTSGANAVCAAPFKVSAVTIHRALPEAASSVVVGPGAAPN
eukprot:15478793-Alexandrium_andersonii.AAC.1